MASFLDLFDTHAPELTAALAPEATPDRAAEAVIAFLDRLQDRYFAENNPAEPEAIAARGGMDVLRAASSLIVSASRTEVWQKAGPGGMPGERKRRYLVWTRTILAVVAVVLVAFLAVVLWTSQQLDALILLGAAVALEVGRVIAAFMASRRSRKADAQAVADIRTRATVHVDSASLLRRLSHAVAAVDKLVADAQGIRPTVASAGPVIEDPAFTELLQDLMEARETRDGEYALRVLRSLQAILERHGIRVISFDGGNAPLFEFQPALTQNRSDETLRPALVLEGRVLRRGLVARGDQSAR